MRIMADNITDRVLHHSVQFPCQKTCLIWAVRLVFVESCRCCCDNFTKQERGKKKLNVFQNLCFCVHSRVDVIYEASGAKSELR